MYVNADTLASLQIIQSESHPNSHMQGPNKSTSGAKESLSVYGLFHYLASTPQGKQKLRQIFLRPSIDLSIINQRLSTIGILLYTENQPMMETIVKSLKRIKDIRALVIHLQKGVSNVPGKASTINGGVWGSLQNFTFHTLKIIEALTELNDGQQIAIATKVVVYDPSLKVISECSLVPDRGSAGTTEQDRSDGHGDHRLCKV